MQQTGFSTQVIVFQPLHWKILYVFLNSMTLFVLLLISLLIRHMLISFKKINLPKIRHMKIWQTIFRMWSRTTINNALLINTPIIYENMLNCQKLYGIFHSKQLHHLCTYPNYLWNEYQKEYQCSHLYLCIPNDNSKTQLLLGWRWQWKLKQNWNSPLPVKSCSYRHPRRLVSATPTDGELHCCSIAQVHKVFITQMKKNMK